MKSIFISHISEEAPLAVVLKEWLESSFPGICQVFVSSDPNDLPIGVRWLDHIDKALRDASILIVLCSRRSLPRPWINFETGCAWMRKISIIPICHTGIMVDVLPPPLSEFQALDLESNIFVSQLVEGIGLQLGLSKHPRIDMAAMRRALIAAQHAIQSKISFFEGSQELEKIPINLKDGVKLILKIILDSSGEGIYESELRKSQDIDGARLTYYLEKMSSAGLIVGSWVKETPTGQRSEWRYWATKEGRKYFFESD